MKTSEMAEEIFFTLDKAEKGKTYRISGYCGEKDKIFRRLLELGFSCGQRVKIISKSLQKKVFLIELRGYVLSVRADLLNRIEVRA